MALSFGGRGARFLFGALQAKQVPSSVIDTEVVGIFAAERHVQLRCPRQPPPAVQLPKGPMETGLALHPFDADAGRRAALDV